MVLVRDLDVRRVVLSLPPGHVNALQDLSTYTPTRPSYSASSSSSSLFSRLLFHPQPFSLSLKLAPTKTAPPPEGFHGRRLKSGSLPCPPSRHPAPTRPPTILIQPPSPPTPNPRLVPRFSSLERPGIGFSKCTVSPSACSRKHDERVATIRDSKDSSG